MAAERTWGSVRPELEAAGWPAPALDVLEGLGREPPGEMGVYLVTPREGHRPPGLGGWDRYEGFVCVARSAADACQLHPGAQEEGFVLRPDDWAWVGAPEHAQAERVGSAAGPARVLLASYLAG